MARKSVKGHVHVVWPKKGKTQIKVKLSDGNTTSYFHLLQTRPNYEAIVAAALTAASAKMRVQLFYDDSNNNVADLAVFG